MKHIWIISDGKPGHLNQSLGLAEALALSCNAEIHTIAMPTSWWGKKISHCLKQAKALPKPLLLIACGHSTHLTLLILSKMHHAPSVVIMKPSWPSRFFDLCLIPEHDKPKPNRSHIIATRGAMNRVRCQNIEKSRGLILIGGPSKNHFWQPNPLTTAIHDIVDSSNLEWDITDSRRTPDSYLNELNHSRLKKYPHQQTNPSWLPEKLAHASEVWVSEDSVSMIFEAASSGARVGLLPMLARKTNGKINQALDSLVLSRHVTRYENWKIDRILPHSTKPLQEAVRCADLVALHFHIT